jgi:AcrR family transcriptional regulator
VATVIDPASGPREAIMDAAVHLFGKQGFSGTSMRDIANAVGVLPGSLYAHIASKEAMLVDIVDDGIHRFLDAVRPHIVSGATPAERLRAMVIAHVSVVADNPERSLVVFHQWRFLGDDNIQAAIGKRRDYEQAFIGVIEDGIIWDISSDSEPPYRCAVDTRRAKLDPGMALAQWSAFTRGSWGGHRGHSIYGPARLKRIFVLALDR